jgi:hypothetical protein
MDMNWEALTAISTLVMALVGIGAVIAVLAIARRVLTLMLRLEKFVDTLDREARPVADKIRDLVADTGRVADKLRKEVESIVDTSQDIRTRLIDAVDDADARLQDVGAMLDVIQDEIEETVLDVGAVLRSTRRGSKVVQGMRRALLGKRRRRR